MSKNENVPPESASLTSEEEKNARCAGKKLNDQPEDGYYLVAPILDGSEPTYVHQAKNISPQPQKRRSR